MKAVYWFLVFLVGCAQVPRPSTYPYTFQPQMQAAHHWHVLAGQVVEELVRVKGEAGYSIEPVYLRSNDTSVFGRAFRSFLTAELANKGIPVSLDPERCDPNQNNRRKNMLGCAARRASCGQDQAAFSAAIHSPGRFGLWIGRGLEQPQLWSGRCCNSFFSWSPFRCLTRSQDRPIASQRSHHYNHDYRDYRQRNILVARVKSLLYQ